MYQISKQFLSKCIKKWEQNNQKCPFRCNNPEYNSNRFLNNIFSKLLKFKCQKGCDEFISYKDINEHYENCKKEGFKSKYYETATQVEVLKVQIENYNDIQNELDQTKEKKEELENELEEIKEEKRDLEYKVDELRDRINELENKLESKSENILNYENLSNELEKEKEKNILLENRINLLEEERIAFEKNMNNSEKKLRTTIYKLLKKSKK